MAALRIRSTIARMVIGIGLVVSLFAGSVTLAQPAHVSAAPLTCAQALSLARYYAALSDVYDTMFDVTKDFGYAVSAGYYRGRAESYYDFC
jgi:hypothetical protein